MLLCAELFTKLLDSQGLVYDLKEEENDVFVGFPYQGKMVRCIFSGENGKYFSIYLLYESVPDEKLADVIFLCNELNAKFKWFTFFVDRDKDLMLHDDAILSVESASEEAFELLIRMLKMGDDVKPIVMKTIYA